MWYIQIKLHLRNNKWLEYHLGNFKMGFNFDCNKFLHLEYIYNRHYSQEKSRGEKMGHLDLMLLKIMRTKKLFLSLLIEHIRGYLYIN